MLIIDFKNPIQIKGINTTVRRGVRKVVPGEIIGLRETGEKYCFSLAEVMSVILVRFKDITDTMLVYEHDYRCRTVQGLSEVLEDVYSGYTEDEIFTLIDYELIDQVIYYE